jgi:hypothetical protein
MRAPYAECWLDCRQGNDLNHHVWASRNIGLYSKTQRIYQRGVLSHFICLPSDSDV